MVVLGWLLFFDFLVWFGALLGFFVLCFSGFLLLYLWWVWLFCFGPVLVCFLATCLCCACWVFCVFLAVVWGVAGFWGCLVGWFCPGLVAFGLGSARALIPVRGFGGCFFLFCFFFCCSVCCFLVSCLVVCLAVLCVLWFVGALGFFVGLLFCVPFFAFCLVRGLFYCVLSFFGFVVWWFLGFLLRFFGLFVFLGFR